MAVAEDFKARVVPGEGKIAVELDLPWLGKKQGDKGTIQQSTIEPCGTQKPGQPTSEFGVRGQSEAATPLWKDVPPGSRVGKRRRRYALRAQSKMGAGAREPP